MIVIEREFLAKWVRVMKCRQDSGNPDYYTGYISAMSTVEGMLAMCPEYDLGKLAEMPHDERPTEGRTEPASAAQSLP